MGVYQGHSAKPRATPGTDQVGGSDGGHLPLPKVRGSGTVMGQKEEQQQHDLRETKSGDEVRLLRCRACGYINRNTCKLSITEGEK